MEYLIDNKDDNKSNNMITIKIINEKEVKVKNGF